LDEVPALSVDYLEVRGPQLEPAPLFGTARMLVAARLGTTRLLDNISIELSGADAPAPIHNGDHHEITWRN